MAVAFAFHAGKAVVQIAALEIAIDYLLDIGPPESILPGEMLIVDLGEVFKIVLNTAVIIGYLCLQGAIDSGRKETISLLSQFKSLSAP